MEQEGRQCLQALAPVDLCAETIEKVHAEFEDFFLQVAVCSRVQVGSASSRMQGSESARELLGAVRFCLLQEVLKDHVQRSQDPRGFLKMYVPGP